MHFIIWFIFKNLIDKEGIFRDEVIDVFSSAPSCSCFEVIKYWRRITNYVKENIREDEKIALTTHDRYVTDMLLHYYPHLSRIVGLKSDDSLERTFEESSIRPKGLKSAFQNYSFIYI